jgi:hypothetical protein
MWVSQAIPLIPTAGWFIIAGGVVVLVALAFWYRQIPSDMSDEEREEILAVRRGRGT